MIKVFSSSILLLGVSPWPLVTSRGFTYLREQAADAESLVMGLEEQLAFFHAVAFGRVGQVSSLVFLHMGSSTKSYGACLLCFACVQNHGRNSAQYAEAGFIPLLLAPGTFGG